MHGKDAYTYVKHLSKIHGKNVRASLKTHKNHKTLAQCEIFSVPGDTVQLHISTLSQK